MKSQLKGIASTFLISVLLLVLFFSKLLFSMNQVFFAAGGDGLLTYVNAEYHARYDSTYTHQENLNYPFGENVFFTGNLLPLSASLKFLKELGVDLTGYTVGMINAMMLFSIPLCAVFLYLIFVRLKLPFLLSIASSVSIAFLSPQIMRFNGHFSLSYCFTIPLVLYLLLLYYEERKLVYSILLSLFIFFISTFHIYYAGILVGLILAFWAYLILFEKDKNSWKQVLVTIVVQVLVSFLLLKLTIHLTDSFSNRTNNPWGYFIYNSYWEGIFLPLKTPLEQFFHRLFYIDKYEFEGIAYIGFVATIGFICIGVTLLWKVLKWKSILNVVSVTDRPVINAFFWAGIACFLF